MIELICKKEFSYVNFFPRKDLNFKTWRSKCGKYIIEHQPEWLCGNTEYAYVDISFIMRRKMLL